MDNQVVEISSKKISFGIKKNGKLRMSVSEKALFECFCWFADKNPFLCNLCFITYDISEHTSLFV